MSPDPFRALDPIDPPDRWDEIVRRAASDEVAVDLDADRLVRPRRRAAVLVAAAAAVALVAGVAIAGVGQDDGDVTTATPPSEPASGVGGPCPFTLDPAVVDGPLVPGEGDPVSPVHLRQRSSEQAPPQSPGSWATTVAGDGDIAVTISVYADAATAATPVDGGRQVVIVGGDPGVVDTTRFAAVEGSATCSTVEVTTRAPLTEEDAALQAAQGDGAVDVERYVDDGGASRILAAVRLVDGGEVSADVTTTTIQSPDVVGGPCPFTLAGEGIPAPVAIDIPRTEGELPDIVRSNARATVDGLVVTVVLGGLPMLEAPMFGPIGNLEVNAGPSAEGPAGTTRVSGLEALPVEPPCQDLQAWVDVPADQVGVATDVVERVLTAVVPAEGFDEADREIRDAARARLAATQEEAERCETDPDACIPMTWEGPTVEGGTYRIEVDQDVIRGFADGEQINTDGEVPEWEDINGETVMGGVGFERSPRPAGMSQDMIFVGARPPGAAETFVVDADGDEIEATTLTISPDGRFYAIHTLELAPGGPYIPWPVHHRAADGAVIEQPPGG